MAVPITLQSKGSKAFNLWVKISNVCVCQILVQLCSVNKRFESMYNVLYMSLLKLLKEIEHTLDGPD